MAGLVTHLSRNRACGLPHYKLSTCSSSLTTQIISPDFPVTVLDSEKSRKVTSSFARNLNTPAKTEFWTARSVIILLVECFHVTSRRPCWYLNNRTVNPTNPLGIKLYYHANVFLCFGGKTRLLIT